MSLMPTTPQSIGGVLDRGIRLYKESFLGCLALTLLVTILMAALMLAFFGKVMMNAKQDPAAMLALVKSPTTWLIYLIVIAVYLAVYNALLVKINGVAHGESVSIGDALGAGLRLVPRTFLLMLLLALILMVGFLLFVVPGIYLYGALQFCIIAAVIDNTAVFESLGTSRRLVKGYWWRSATIGFVALIIIMVFSFIAGLISGLLTAFLKDMVTSFVLQQVVSLIINVATITLYPSIMLSNFFDLKLRHEGGDLAARVNAL